MMVGRLRVLICLSFAVAVGLAGTAVGAGTAPSGVLAVVTTKGVALWSGGQLRRIGPAPAVGETDTSPTWSADGAYVAWEEYGPKGVDLQIADVNTGRVHSVALEAFIVSMTVTNSGAVNLLDTAGGPTVILPSGVVRSYRGAKIYTTAATYSAGTYEVVPLGSNFDQPVVERYTTSGSSKQVVALPRLASSAPPYELAWATSDGSLLVIEHGDHTDACGVGPTSTLTTVTATGRTAVLQLPAFPAGVQRLRDLEFGPGGSFDAALLGCPGAGGPPFTARVAAYVGGRWTVLGGGSGVIAAALSPQGVQAVVHGRLVQHGTVAPNPVPAGGGVLVGGVPVSGLPGPATAVAWSPVP